MVRPEPYEPFGETELGRERGVETRFRLFEVDLLRNGGSRIGLRCGRRLGLGVFLHAGRRRGGFGSRSRSLALRLALGALDEARARALYLGTTVYQIHGTNAPETVGHAGVVRLLPPRQQRNQRPL